MSLRFHASLAFALLLILPAVVNACLWDYDTLKQELARFPTTLELITGKFPRHSREFYEWRIRDRLEKLKADPKNLAYHDDLAVAYEKTGEHDKAIATMLAKEEIKPGLYETYSNLGTFHILAGDFEEGLPYIDKALAINPHAHFGREKYQKWLVEYAMSKRTDDGTLTFPLSTGNRRNDGLHVAEDGFHVFIAEKIGKKHAPARDAAKAVLGMMRFAHHDNPLLLEALGDLLSAPAKADAKQLAARAYLQASYVVDDPRAQEAYRKLAEEALVAQAIPNTKLKDFLAEVEKQLAQEQKNADEWYADFYAHELQWIREGKNADAEFDRYAAKLQREKR